MQQRFASTHYLIEKLPSEIILSILPFLNLDSLSHLILTNHSFLEITSIPLHLAQAADETLYDCRYLMSLAKKYVHLPVPDSNSQLSTSAKKILTQLKQNVEEKDTKPLSVNDILTIAIQQNLDYKFDEAKEWDETTEQWRQTLNLLQSVRKWLLSSSDYCRAMHLYIHTTIINHKNTKSKDLYSDVQLSQRRVIPLLCESNNAYYVQTTLTHLAKANFLKCIQQFAHYLTNFETHINSPVNNSLVVAISSGHAEVAKYLLKYTFQLSSVFKETALLNAIEKQMEDVVEALLNHPTLKYDINGNNGMCSLGQENEPMTPLVVAAHTGNVNMIKLLISKHANPFLLVTFDTKIVTALDVARAQQHTSAVALLEDYENEWLVRKSLASARLVPYSGMWQQLNDLDQEEKKSSELKLRLPPS